MGDVAIYSTAVPVTYSVGSRIEGEKTGIVELVVQIGVGKNLFC